MDPVSSGTIEALKRLQDYQERNPKPPAESDTPSEQVEGVTLSITPSEGNAQPGEDRSQNSVIVELSAPGRQASAEVTREQAVDALERRSTRKLATQALGGPSLGGPSPLAVAAVTQNSNSDELQASAVQYAQLQYTRNTAQFAFGLAGASTPSQSSSSSGSPDDFADFANQALAMQRKQAVFAASLDKLENAGNNIDTTV